MIANRRIAIELRSFRPAKEDMTNVDDRAHFLPWWRAWMRQAQADAARARQSAMRR